MFPHLMDPNAMRTAREQMARMPPEEIERLQQMMTPEMTKLAMESMKNISPEELRRATEQMKDLTPEQISEMSSSFDASSVNITLKQRQNYELNASGMLKSQGNQLHGAGKYVEAAEKYSKALSNLVNHNSPEASSLKLACEVNLMSCHLKTKEYNKVVTHGNQVLRVEPKNVKALYRRGQAFQALGELTLAVNDLREAAKLSPFDETLVQVLRSAEKAEKEGLDIPSSSQQPNGVTIEDITDEEEAKAKAGPTATQSTRDKTAGSRGAPLVPPGAPGLDDPSLWRQMEALQQNPDLVRQMQSVVAKMDPSLVASLSGGRISPAMAAAARDAMAAMDATQLQEVMHASATPAAAPPPSSHPPPPPPSHPPPPLPSFPLPPGPSSTSSSSSSFPAFGSTDFGQLQEQMNNPEMMKMVSEMMNSMSPESMAAMSEASGVKMSVAQAEAAKKMMGKLTPEQMNKMMLWANRIGQVTEQSRRLKTWLLERPFVMLAVVFLILAIFLQYFGYVR